MSDAPQYLDPEGAGSLLLDASQTRMPNMEGLGREQRASKIEDYIYKTATVRGELATLRLSAHVDLKLAKKEWDGLKGWERYKTRSGDRTKEAERAAKSEMRPDLASRIENAEFTIARCSEEMSRMDRDYESASRAYTILSGS